MKRFLSTSTTFLVLLLLFVSLPIFAQNIASPVVALSPEKGLLIESQDGFMGLKLGFRLQQQLIFTAPFEENEAAQTDFLIRRGRILLSGYLFEKKLDYLIQLGMDRGQVTLLNAEYRWKLDSKTKISVGQFFPPVGRQFQTVSKNLQLVDRSDVTRFFFTDYDLGFAFRRTISINRNFGIKTAFAVTHGEGKNVSTAPGGWAYTGRFEILPFGMFHVGGDYSESDLYRESKPKLSLGTAYYLNQDAYTKFGNSAWDGLEDNYSEYYFDAVFKYNGLSFLGEYIHRSVDNERLKITPTSEIFSNKTSGEGFYVQGGKFITKNIEPTLRFSILNPNDEAQTFNGKFISQNKYEIGINNFYKEHSIKIQSQIALVKQDFQNQNSRTYIEVLTQFSISF
tara:strand:+ start:38171 stop:39358 length:1188 start_codon:yes stop_codon:yes gene_type:complete